MEWGKHWETTSVRMIFKKEPKWKNIFHSEKPTGIYTARTDHIPDHYCGDSGHHFWGIQNRYPGMGKR
jgi:hypothetical protein